MHTLALAGEQNPLNTSTFDNLVQFARRANVTLIYDLNELYGREAGQPWNGTATRSLLQHALQSGTVLVSRLSVVLGSK
jgi:hypothetical protein